MVYAKTGSKLKASADWCHRSTVFQNSSNPDNTDDPVVSIESINSSINVQIDLRSSALAKNVIQYTVRLGCRYILLRSSRPPEARYSDLLLLGNPDISSNIGEIERGLEHLDLHIHSVHTFGFETVIAINCFTGDSTFDKCCPAIRAQVIS